MITFETFENTINAIKAVMEKDEKLLDLIGEGISMYSHDTIEAMTNLLIDAIKDTGGYISWWMWETNFGEDPEMAFLYEDEKGRSVASIEDFYSFLVDNYNGK